MPFTEIKAFYKKKEFLEIHAWEKHECRNKKVFQRIGMNEDQIVNRKTVLELSSIFSE